MTSPRLLLVDDDPDLGIVVRILARKSGHSSTHCLDARSACRGNPEVSAQLELLSGETEGLRRSLRPSH